MEPYSASQFGGYAEPRKRFVQSISGPSLASLSSGSALSRSTAGVTLHQRPEPYRIVSVSTRHTSPAGGHAMFLTVLDGAANVVCTIPPNFFPLSGPIQTTFAVGSTYQGEVGVVDGVSQVTASLPLDLIVMPNWSVVLSITGVAAPGLTFAGLVLVTEPA